MDPIKTLCEQIRQTATPKMALRFEKDSPGKLNSFVGAGPGYWPTNKGLPCDKRETDYQTLLLQINFSELRGLAGFPEEGILQLWADGSGSDLQGCDDCEDHRFVFHDQVDVSAPSWQERLAHEVPDIDTYINTEGYPLAAAGVLKISAGAISASYAPPGTIEFDAHVDYELFDEHDEHPQVAELQKCDGSFLGGIPFFLQNDVRQADDANENKGRIVHLLQIDSEDGVNLGDGGIFHVFIRDKHLKRGDLGKAWCTWDCL